MSAPGDNNQYPVDSATRPCCGGIGTHTLDCTVYLADRYDRLTNVVNQVATTPEFFYPEFVTPEALRELGEKVKTHRLLDGLTDKDADVVSGITVITFPGGIPKMCQAISGQCFRIGGYLPTDENEAVTSTLAKVLNAAYEIYEAL